MNDRWRKWRRSMSRFIGAWANIRGSCALSGRGNLFDLFPGVLPPANIRQPSGLAPAAEDNHRSQFAATFPAGYEITGFLPKAATINARDFHACRQIIQVCNPLVSR